MTNHLTTLTTNTEILPLMIRLTELAPELCLHEPIGFNQVHRFRLTGNIAAVIDLKEGSEPDQLDYAIIQWVLQGAIVAQGLVVKLKLSRSQEWQADLEWGDWSQTDKNPAIALLAAFVAALEAV